MAKKNQEDKKDKFIKIMLTEEEFKHIERYARREFQTKSEFIRSAIRNRFHQIDTSIYPQKTDPKFKHGRLRRSIMKELKPVIEEHKTGEFLEKPDEEEMKERKKMLEERKKELEKELENINQALIP